MNNEKSRSREGLKIGPGQVHFAAGSQRPAARMHRLAASLIGLFALFLCGFAPPTLIDRDEAPGLRLTVGQLRQIRLVRSAPPEATALAILVFDVDSRRVLVSDGADLPVAPASLAKLMTALLVLEQNRLTEDVTVQTEDLVGGATMALFQGVSLRVEQLLWGLLVPSGNDAAMALARHHSGDMQAFVERMNQRADELNLGGTHFANPNGFDAPGQVTNAQDLLSLILTLWEYPLFRQIVGTESVTVAGRELHTTNSLLGSYPGANGVKTGTTFWSGQSLAAGVERDGHQIFAIVLGSTDRYFDVRLVLDSVQRNFKRAAFQLPDRPTALDRVFDSEGIRWHLRTDGAVAGDQAEASRDILLNGWELRNLRSFRRLHPPPLEMWNKGMQAGELEWRLGDDVVATQRLVIR